MHGPPELPQRVPPTSLLGYLNLSDGRPDPRFQSALSEAFGVLTESGDPAPWQTLPKWLLAECDALAESDSAAFRDTTQARAIIRLGMRRLPEAYREHHADLLAHQSDGTLFAPFFVARCCEAVLSQGPPWGEGERILDGALAAINDFVGYRPIAMLETRPQTDYYAHEKVRPVPLFVRDAGVGSGKYHDLIAATLGVLNDADPSLRETAQFDPALLDELAFDPRAYDHQHPVNRRPNYLFGEWDPHHIDNAGRYRRYVVRQEVLDALLLWTLGRISNPSPTDGLEIRPTEEAADRLTEAASVLAGTILMGSGVSGAGPEYHDSDVTLAKLVPVIARYRDRFYADRLEQITGPHAERLRDEAKKRRQPFARVRQHLNQVLAKQRAAQLRESRLAVVFAEMGHPEASRRRARVIPAASVRFMTEMHVRQTDCRLALDREDRNSASQKLTEAEDFLRRGIDCGALPDPWNILGFQGLFPLFQSREDSARDHRNEELIDVIDRQFELYARLLAVSASAGEDERVADARGRMAELAEWWDAFATAEVNDMPRVHGGERTEAAEHVARSLALWRDSGPRLTGPLTESPEQDEVAFWREHRDGFRAPSAFAPVIAALIDHEEWKSAGALLLTWVSEADSIVLEDGPDSFRRCANRWIEGVTRLPRDVRKERVGTLAKFFELLEASAEDRWEAPTLPTGEADEGDEDSDSELYDAAYEDVSYRDSADDGEGALAGGDDGPEREAFPLEESFGDLEQRLAFFAALADLWSETATDQMKEEGERGRAGEGEKDTNGSQEAVSPSSSSAEHRAWRDAALGQWQGLIAFVESVAALPIPDPVGGFEDVMESDQRRYLKSELFDIAIDTTVEMGRAVRALAALAEPGAAPSEFGLSEWEPTAVRLEQAIGESDADRVRELLSELLPALSREPLLFVPISSGGTARGILKVRSAHSLLGSLLERLPKLGLFRETYHLLALARDMEQNPAEGQKRVSEFDRLFNTALTSLVESLLRASDRWMADGQIADEMQLNALLRRVADSFLSLWVTHSQGLRLSIMETVTTPEWNSIREFVSAYGAELFTAQYLSIANLRGVLNTGVGPHLDSLMEQDDPLKPLRLVADLEESRLSRATAEARLETILSAVAENYDVYTDYNATTVQSDYGENLGQFLEFLRLKARYDRFAWKMRPMALAHRVLCRDHRDEMADRWRAGLADFSNQMAGELLQELAAVEARVGMRLQSVRDRLEERFVRPLLLERMCAAVKPAMRPGDDEAFAKFEAQLDQFPDGGGFDVPPWLRRLEEEVGQIRDEGGEDREEDGEVPVSFEDFQRQLGEWDRPL